MITEGEEGELLGKRRGGEMGGGGERGARGSNMRNEERG